MESSFVADSIFYLQPSRSIPVQCTMLVDNPLHTIATISISVFQQAVTTTVTIPSYGGI